MWVARNRLGDLRIFEFPPRRFHSGSCLSSEDTGFNDDVYIGNGKDDTYSFWAIQKYYESDVIDDHASYGLTLYESSNEKDIICKQYEPSWAKDLKWEDEPIEVMIESLEELRKGQIELKNVYHELIDYKTKQIESLTRVCRGVALEDVADIIKDLEENIYRKYEMVGNPYAEQNMRQVSIAGSMMKPSDNSLREYIIDDKVVVTIYVRRNDFNNADILVSDLGDEYNIIEKNIDGI